MNIFSLLLPALLPAFSDGLKQLFSRVFSGGTPSITDQIALKQADAQMITAIAQMDTIQGQNVSKWVADLRGSFRYLGAGLILIVTMISLFSDVPKDYVDIMLQLSASVFSFMFGDRVYLHLKK